jgi:SAM-dependent methyltransferase
MLYAVQTNTKVVERCILMTTDPGDLVFDPTCGSGTTAYCAEKWGRRWITCDTSRVALAIARQRLMTAKFDYYELRDPERGPAGGFIYETVPHITLESIAKNTEIDAIAARYQPQIEQALAELNAALKGKPIRIRIAEGGRAGQVVDFSAPDTETVPLPSGQVVKANELLEWEVPREVPHPVWPEEAKQAYWRLYALKNNPFPVGADPLREMGQPQGVAPAGDADVGAGLRACPDAGQPQGVAPAGDADVGAGLRACPDAGQPQGVAPAGDADVGAGLRACPDAGQPQGVAPTGDADVGAGLRACPDAGQPQGVAPTGDADVGAGLRACPDAGQPQGVVPAGDADVGAGLRACPDAGQPQGVAPTGDADVGAGLRACPDAGQPQGVAPAGDADVGAGLRACPDAGQPQGVAPAGDADVGAGLRACPDAGQPQGVVPAGDADVGAGLRACPDAGQPQGVAPTGDVDVGAGLRACPDAGQPQGVAPAGDADVGAGLRACPDAGQPQGVAPTDVYTAQEETKRLLETVYRLTGHRWENLGKVPDPMPPEDWPDAAKDALRRFWELKRQKRKEIDESIQRNAPQEVLYDRPRVVRGVVRVTGPFTVEAIPVPAVEDPTQAPIPQFEDSVGVDPRACPDAGQPQGVAPTSEPGRINDRGGDYLTMMINLLKQQGGVLFPGGKKLELMNIRPLHLGYLHAEAEAKQNGNTLRVAISFGPQHGPVIAHQVQEAIPAAKVNGYQVLSLRGSPSTRRRRRSSRKSLWLGFRCILPTSPRMCS